MFFFFFFTTNLNDVTRLTANRFKTGAKFSHLGKGTNNLGPNIHWTSNYGTGIVSIGNIYWKYIVLAEFS